MTVLERIKGLCKNKGISITTLEAELEYSNGSLSKAKDIPSSRIMEISKFFEVSMDYLMTGKESPVLLEIAETDVALTNMEKRMKEYALKLAALPKDKQEHIFESIDMLNEK